MCDTGWLVPALKIGVGILAGGVLEHCRLGAGLAGYLPQLYGPFGLRESDGVHHGCAGLDKPGHIIIDSSHFVVVDHV